jgi:hypothetical protein
MDLHALKRAYDETDATSMPSAPLSDEGEQSVTTIEDDKKKQLHVVRRPARCVHAVDMILHFTWNFMILFVVLGAGTLYFRPSFFLDRLDYSCWDQNWNNQCDVLYDDYNGDGICDERDCGLLHGAASVIFEMIRTRNITVLTQHVKLTDIGYTLINATRAFNSFNATYDILVNQTAVDINTFNSTRNSIQAAARGPMGLKGDKGASGVVFYTTGVNGLKGDKGDKGAMQIGITGATGGKGVKGMMGAEGDSGPTYIGIDISGATGATGVKGIKGVTGDIGDQGDQKPDGTKGDKGSIGNAFAGAQGDTGSTGDKGDAGIKGIKGVTGTSLKGVMGTTGDTGSKGSKGLPFSPVTYPTCDNTMVRIGGNRIQIHECMHRQTVPTSSSVITLGTRDVNPTYRASTAAVDAQLGGIYGMVGRVYTDSGLTDQDYTSIFITRMFRCVLCGGYTILIGRFYNGTPANTASPASACIGTHFGLANSDTIADVRSNTGYILVRLFGGGEAVILRMRTPPGAEIDYTMTCPSAVPTQNAWTTIQMVIQSSTGVINIKINGMTCSIAGNPTVTMTVNLLPVVASRMNSACQVTLPSSLDFYLLVDYIHFSNAYIDGVTSL